jgi:hypothetical protein
MKINYSFTARTPLFTGSDENNGTVRKLRREKRLLKEPVRFKSSFKNKIERTKTLMDVIYQVYANIDPKLKTENYGFYKAYANKVKAATSVPNKKQFLSRLLESCGIDVLSDGSSQVVRKAMDHFTDIEFLETIREEHQYLMILLREYVNYYKSNESKEIGGQMNLFGNEENLVENISFQKNFENVPYFGGNSIRGYLRRLIMHDFCKHVGITKLSKDTYHQLFTGGNITDSTSFENIEKREQYISMCPPIGLLGSAIGNMTIEGELKVIGGRLRCKENGSGELSYWQLIEMNFGTRHDSSKTEKEIEIKGDQEAKSQMIYQYENFVTGSVFDSAFVLTTNDDLLVSAFWRMMRLWQEHNVIGGNSARDSGMIDIHINIPKAADNKYLEYIRSNREKIQEYFNA